MVFSIAARAASRRVGLIAKQSTQRRHMAGGGHAAPEWEGIDKIVRGYFPGDHQLALAIMGGYFGLFLVVKAGGAMGGKKKVEAAAPVTTSSGPSTGIPSVESAEFGDFLGSEAFEKLLASDEQFGKVLAEMK